MVVHPLVVDLGAAANVAEAEVAEAIMARTVNLAVKRPMDFREDMVPELLVKKVRGVLARPTVGVDSGVVDTVMVNLVTTQRGLLVGHMSAIVVLAMGMK